jgi:hypothetical protein
MVIGKTRGSLRIFDDGGADRGHRGDEGNLKLKPQRGLRLLPFDRPNFTGNQRVTTTVVPTDTRPYRSVMSELSIRMQP